jgi:hypothetical protein
MLDVNEAPMSCLSNVDEGGEDHMLWWWWIWEPAQVTQRARRAVFLVQIRVSNLVFYLAFSSAFVLLTAVVTP